MKMPRFALVLAVAWCATFTTAQSAESTRVYEMRTYTTLPGRLPALLARFRDHTLKIFESHGMVNVGYWVPADAKDNPDNTLIYVLEHKSREAAAASWKAFRVDPAWQAAQKKSEADGKIVAKVDFVFLSATDFSKAMNSGNGKGGRVFERRTYTAADGKLAALDSRFRDHTVALFAKHGITNLGYFHPVDADKGSANTLVYFLAYPNREAAAASWKAFAADADWMKARKASEVNGKLTSKVESIYLTPVDFSALK
ncbi:MAG: NIPSNAP family protein [Opitutus sp.]|nr:NIPSNAP family protein [Opitutus sp.]